MFLIDVENEKVPVEELEKEKKRSPFDFSSSIDSKESLREEVEKNPTSYSVFMINNIYSRYKETIFIANELNRFPNIDPVQHYDFLFHALPKRKRFAKWAKVKYSEEDVDMVVNYYSINRLKALDVMDLVDLNEIKKSFYRGGAK